MNNKKIFCNLFFWVIFALRDRVQLLAKNYDIYLNETLNFKAFVLILPIDTNYN